MEKKKERLEAVQNRLVAALPSRPLREAVLRQKHCFSEIDLLAIAYRYSENHQEKTAAMLMLADALPEPFSSYARSMAEWMGKSFELFTQQEAGAVFELHIQTEPNTYDERYLCADYDTALRMIPLFFEEYESEEGEHVQYDIVKRKVISGNAFFEDEMGRCCLGPNRTVRAVRLHDYPQPNQASCDGYCSECQRLCVRRVEISFPCFVHDGDIVAFTNPHDRYVRYGVSLFGEATMPEDYCVIPFDAHMFRCRYYDKYVDAHEHIAAPYILELLTREQLPPKYRQHYDCVMKKAAEEAGGEFS